MSVRLPVFIRQRPLVVLCVAFVLTLGVGNYFLWTARATSAQEHVEARRKGEFMLRALANRTKIDADLAALNAALAQIERHLVDEESMEVNLGYFYKLEKPARVRLVRLNQLAAVTPPTKSKFKSVGFSLQVTGSYRNTMSFLRALESGPRIVRIRNCSFERSSIENGDFVLDLTLDALAKS